MIYKIIVFVLLVVRFVSGQVYLDLPEGSKCSRDGVDGVCASVYNCLNAAEDIKEKDFPSICTYRNREPIICCTDCELVNDTRNMYISPTSGMWYFRNGEKARDSHFQGTIAKRKHPQKNCYISYPTAVGAAGGVDAKRDEFPHMALLGYGYDEESAQWLCGGSLISENFILTAAHCISSPSLGEVKYIALGVLKRTDPPEIWQKYNVKRIIAHPQYKPPSKYNDIALLETRGRVSFNDHVMPACLHYELVKYDNEAEATGWGALGHRRELADTLQSVSMMVKYDNEAEATGWGALGHRRELADTLQSVRLEEFSEDECSRLYPIHRHLKKGYDHNSQMCYGHRKEVKDTCEGDSGGPLQNKYHITSCQYVVIGVTSSGRQCGFVGTTGVYTRVRYYLRWIEDVVWP